MKKNKKKFWAIIGVIIILLVIFLNVYNNTNYINNWEKIDIGNYEYNETTILELDLDGDSNKEKVNIKSSGKYIYINDKEYVINKYLDENKEDIFMFNGLEMNDYNINQYYIVDLNKDGILEIIHRTYSNMISPTTSKYTIYNYINNNLNEIGNISIIGNMPDEIYVKGNKIKFEYWPYESPKGDTKEVICELNV